MQWIAHRRLRLKDFDQLSGLVDAYLSQSDLHTFLMLAERRDNPAGSVTNHSCVLCARDSHKSTRSIGLMTLNPRFLTCPKTVLSAMVSSVNNFNSSKMRFALSNKVSACSSVLFLACSFAFSRCLRTQ